MNTPKPLVLIPIAALLLLAGCVVTSVYPYFTAKDLISNEALVGKWAEADESNVAENHWVFSRTNGLAYTLTVRDGPQATEFKAHLFELKGRRYIDAEPIRREDHFIPAHYVLQVKRLDDSRLELCALDYKWLTSLLEKKPKALAHHWVDREAGTNSGGQLVLTAETAALQAFIAKHAGDTNAFPVVYELVRQ